MKTYYDEKKNALNNILQVIIINMKTIILYSIYDLRVKKKKIKRYWYLWCKNYNVWIAFIIIQFTSYINYLNIIINKIV